MTNTNKLSYKGDPSDTLQLFPRYNLHLLCCRYWWLKKWEYRELAFPYWRIYYNFTEGALINSEGIKHQLSPDKIYLIAPNTSYSTHLFDRKIPLKGYALEGGRISQNWINSTIDKSSIIQHLFIHFNIGIPYDNVSSGIFTFVVTPHIREKITIITDHLSIDNTQFSFYSFLAIQSLISDLLSEIEEKNWELLSQDYRILNSLNYIENNIDLNLTNSVLANNCQMATNSFMRLFKEELGISPQIYIRQKRINKACIMLHHSEESIEAIAEKTGFTNRYHFTRIFTRTTGLSPARYRKEFKIS